MPIFNGSLEKRDQICSQLFNLCLIPNEQFKFEPGFVEIYDLLERLIQIESDIPYCGANKRDEASFGEFWRFLKQNECCDVDSQFGFDHFENAGYGVKTKRDFQKSDVLFRIPKSIILTVSGDQAAANAADRELADLMKKDKLLNAMPNVCLALLVLYLKTSKSTKRAIKRWHAYLNILPSEFSTPLYFSLDEIRLLQASNCFNDVLLHFRSIVRQYAYLVNLLKSQKGLNDLKENFSYANYRWCVSVVSTRQNQIVDEMKKPILALIPLLDMCNHDSENDQLSTDFDDENHFALCLAPRDLKQGDEVKIFYGRRSNAEMLIHNGFVPESNKYDSFKLKLSLSPHDALGQRKVDVLKQFGLNSAEFFTLRLNEPVPTKIYLFIKVFISKSDDDLKKCLEFDAAKTNGTFGIDQDEDVVKFFETRLRLLVGSLEKAAKKLSESSQAGLTNRLFIKRLIEHEINILNSFLTTTTKKE